MRGKPPGDEANARDYETLRFSQIRDFSQHTMFCGARRGLRHFLTGKHEEMKTGRIEIPRIVISCFS
jgi:hypothetical protein